MLLGLVTDQGSYDARGTPCNLQQLGTHALYIAELWNGVQLALHSAQPQRGNSKTAFNITRGAGDVEPQHKASGAGCAMRVHKKRHCALLL